MSLPTTGTGRSVWSVQFFQEDDGIAFLGGTPNIDDLPSADCTIEGWAKLPIGVSAAEVFSKTNAARTIGWAVYWGGAIMAVRLFHATANATVIFGATDDGAWHHYAVDWDFGTLTARGFLDGELIGTSTAIGAYLSDAAEDCLVNSRGTIGTADGYTTIGPLRLSNSRRYTGASFDPPRRINWPANDANAQLITRMNDGAGATVTDYSGNGYDGTITFGANTRWYNDPV